MENIDKVAEELFGSMRDAKPEERECVNSYIKSISESESKILTVDSLLDLLTEVSNAGCGDYKIKCNDAFLHKDEISILHHTKEIQFRGYIFNQPIFEKFVRLKEDIQKAGERFLED